MGAEKNLRTKLSAGVKSNSKVALFGKVKMSGKLIKNKIHTILSNFLLSLRPGSSPQANGWGPLVYRKIICYC